MVGIESSKILNNYINNGVNSLPSVLFLCVTFLSRLVSFQVKIFFHKNGFCYDPNNNGRAEPFLSLVHYCF